MNRSPYPGSLLPDGRGRNRWVMGSYSARRAILAAASVAAVLMSLNVADAQRIRENSMIGSVSGQFYVSARAASRSAQSLELAAEPNMMAVEPALLVVSCERVREELLRVLALRDEGPGRIFIVLQPAQSASDPVAVVPERFAGKWNCHVRLPDAIDRDRLAETIVRACLLEIANRNATYHSAEIPEWLVQGLTRQLIGSREDELILQPPDTRENGLTVKRFRVDLTDDPRISGPNTGKFNPLAEAIEIMHTNAPLTFDQLSWPTQEEISGDKQRIYQSSAQLFVSQVLRLKDGATGLRTMLAELPNYLNWQLAFLDAFRADFAQPINIEKWWALQVVQFTGRDLLHLWTPAESWRQLDVFFRFPIDVQIGPGAPLRTDITFQTIIRGWSRTRQLQMLKKKLWDLDLVRMHVAPDFMPLVDEYRQVLEEYFKEVGTSGRALPQSSPIVDKAVEEALQQLNALDARRAAMRPELQAPANTEQADRVQSASP